MECFIQNIDTSEFLTGDGLWVIHPWKAGIFKFEALPKIILAGLIGDLTLCRAKQTFENSFYVDCDGENFAIVVGI